MHALDFFRVPVQAPEHDPNVKQVSVQCRRRQRCSDESLQALAWRVWRVVQRLLQAAHELAAKVPVRFRNQLINAGKVMVDESNGHARRGCDSPYREALMPALLETRDRRIDERPATIV